MQSTIERIGNPEGFIYDPSLVLYLPLHQLDGSSFMSKDAYGHLCTVTGASWRPDGHYFDGTDDYIDCGNGASLNPTDEVTVIAWLNPNFSSATFYGIVSKFQGTPAGWQLYWNTAQYLYFYVNDDQAVNTVKDVLVNDTWQHVAVTLKSDSTSKSKIYVNAVDKTNTVSSRTLQANDINVVIGVASSTKNNPFNGLIGEVAVYNRALTPLEVQHNYLATKWRYR